MKKLFVIVILAALTSACAHDDMTNGEMMMEDKQMDSMSHDKMKMKDDGMMDSMSDEQMKSDDKMDTMSDDSMMKKGSM